MQDDTQARIANLRKTILAKTIRRARKLDRDGRRDEAAVAASDALRMVRVHSCAMSAKQIREMQQIAN